MDQYEWVKLREDAESDIYEVLSEFNCGPFDGGCVLIAMALQRALGGEIVSLVRANSDIADHAALSVDGVLWDIDGPLLPSEFIGQFERNELSALGHVCGGYRPLKPTDLEDAPRDEQAVERLTEIIRTMLSSPSFEP